MALVSIQRGSTIIPNNATSATITAGVDFTLNAPSDGSKWFVRVTNTRHTGMGKTAGGAAQQLQGWTVWTERDVAAGTATFTRFAAPNFDDRVDWEVWEWTGPSGHGAEWVVRDHLLPTFTTELSQTVDLSTLGVVDPARVLPMITGQAVNDTFRDKMGSGLFRCTISGSTLTVERGEADTDAKVAVAILEFVGTDWTIYQYDVQFTGPTHSQPIAINDPSRAWIEDQHIYLANTNYCGLQDAGYVCRITGPTEALFEAPSGTAWQYERDTLWIVESSNPKMAVSRYYGTMAGVGEEEVEDIPITAVADASRTSLTGTADSTGNGHAYPRGSINFILLDPSTIRIRQSDNGKTSRYALEVVEWPYDGIIGTGVTADAQDTAAGTAAVIVSGASAVTDGADAAAGTATVAVTGSGLTADTQDAATGITAVLVAGAGSTADAADTAAGNGAALVAGAGTAQDGADTATGAIAATVSGAGAATDSADAASGAGAVAMAGAGATGAVADAPDVAAGVGAALVTATGTATDNPDAAAGLAGAAVAGAGAATDSPDATAGLASSLIAGAGVIADGEDAATGSVSVLVAVTGAIVEQSDTAVGTGPGGAIVFVVPPERRIAVPVETRRAGVPAEARTGTVPAEARRASVAAEARRRAVAAESRALKV